MRNFYQVLTLDGAGCALSFLRSSYGSKAFGENHIPFRNGAPEAGSRVQGPGPRVPALASFATSCSDPLLLSTERLG